MSRKTKKELKVYGVIDMGRKRKDKITKPYKRTKINKGDYDLWTRN